MSTNPGPWEIILPYKRALPGLSANDRTHWRQKAKSTATLREVVYHLVRAAHVPALDKIRITITWIVADKRVRDSDNLMPFAKAIYDAIGSNRGISARIVEDDSPEFMTKTFPIIEYREKATPHFIVTIFDEGTF